MALAVRMFRFLSLAMLISLSFNGFAQSASGKAPMDPAKLHQKLIDRHVGKGVKVTEIDGTVVNGVLVSIDADSFQVTPKDATHPMQLMNNTVAKLNNTGLSTASKIGIGVLIGIVALIAAIAISLKASGF